MTSAINGPCGHGSACAAPRLAEGFTDIFTSRWVQLDDLRLHAVTGGQGRALLLLAGWPQTWYAWRHIMPSLAATFTVVAPDTRGMGLSDKPRAGYDTGSLAADMVGLMSALGHDRFAVGGHDLGMWIAYALAADYPRRVSRVAMAEAIVPGLVDSPPLFMTKGAVNGK
jgi:pimeloyl-ACP methyl ester carboxylesterase